MIKTANGIAWEEPTRKKEDAMDAADCKDAQHDCRKEVFGEIAEVREVARSKLSWSLFCYIVGGIVFIGLIIGGYFIARTEAANDKCGSLAERMSNSERDREAMRGNIQDMRDSLKEIERYIRETK